MRKEFVMRGQVKDFKSTSAAGNPAIEVLNFGKYKLGTAYRITEFQLFPSANIAAQPYEITGSLTAGKTPLDPENPDFTDEGLIATGLVATSTSQPANEELVVINDTYMITQNLLLTCTDTHGNPVNWQCRFESVKMTAAEEAAVNFKQFTISDGS